MNDAYLHLLAAERHITRSVRTSRPTGLRLFGAADATEVSDAAASGARGRPTHRALRTADLSRPTDRRRRLWWRRGASLGRA